MRLGFGVLLALLVLPACERTSEPSAAGARAVPATPAQTTPAPRTPAPAASPAADALVWRTLGSWSGRGPRQTESFDVSTGALRVTWQTRDAGAKAGGTFSVVLHSAISGRELQTVVTASELGGATVYVQDEPRVSYLVIHATDVKWRVSIDEGNSTGTR